MFANANKSSAVNLLNDVIQQEKRSKKAENVLIQLCFKKDNEAVRVVGGRTYSS